MTREQAIHCRKYHISVEVPGDEDFKTGFVSDVSNNLDIAVVEWDDDTSTVCALHLLAVQYPEQMEVVA